MLERLEVDIYVEDGEKLVDITKDNEGWQYSEEELKKDWRR